MLASKRIAIRWGWATLLFSAALLWVGAQGPAGAQPASASPPQEQTDTRPNESSHAETTDGKTAGAKVTDDAPDASEAQTHRPTGTGDDDQAKAPSLPGIKIDRQARSIDVQARVANREAEWLELLACTPGGREWETILTVDAKPSHIHLAMMIAGLKPGKPLTWTRTQDDYIIHPPAGDRVAVTLHYVDQTNRQMDIPANQWIRNSVNNEQLKDHYWVFAGSRMARIDSDQGPKQVYLGDLEGNVLSLVNFGDDVLAKPNTRVNHNGQAIWIPKRSLIPAVGTPVTIRITAAPRPQAHQPPEDKADHAQQGDARDTRPDHHADPQTHAGQTHAGQTDAGADDKAQTDTEADTEAEADPSASTGEAPASHAGP